MRGSIPDDVFEAASRDLARYRLALAEAEQRVKTLRGIVAALEGIADRAPANDHVPLLASVAEVLRAADGVGMTTAEIVAELRRRDRSLPRRRARQGVAAVCGHLIRRGAPIHRTEDGAWVWSAPANGADKEAGVAAAGVES